MHSQVHPGMLCFTPLQPCTSDCSHLSETLPAQGGTLIKICKARWWELALNTQEPAFDRSWCRPTQLGTGSSPAREGRAARRALLKAVGSEVCLRHSMLWSSELYLGKKVCSEESCSKSSSSASSWECVTAATSIGNYNIPSSVSILIFLRRL